MPCPLQAKMASEPSTPGHRKRSQAPPKKPSSQAHRPVKRSQRPRFEHSSSSVVPRTLRAPLAPRAPSAKTETVPEPAAAPKVESTRLDTTATRLGTSACSVRNATVMVFALPPEATQALAPDENDTATSVSVGSASSAASTCAAVAAWASGAVVRWRKARRNDPESARHSRSWTSLRWPRVPGSSPRGQVRSEQSYPAQPASQSQPKTRSRSQVSALLASVP
mmetsp:Transcript_23483/g.79318  ORF Transcript_23483/g.79318 Transcript_23483/m.79318 type:complete len:223 (-) Transcript_23483:1411-2079(-)